MIQGLDISAYQPFFDLEKAYLDVVTPMRFCIFKETEGEGWKSDYSHAQWEDLERVVAKYGADSAVGGSYHFARWDTPRDVKQDAYEEADWFWKRETIRRERGHGAGVKSLPPTVDVEWITGKKRDAKSLLAWVMHFCERTTVNWGRPPMIYIGPSFWRYCVLTAGPEARALTQFLLWIVDYNSPMGRPKKMIGTDGAAAAGTWPFVLHQYTGKGKISGVYTGKDRKILAPVDKNIFNGSMDDLIRLAA